MMEPFALFLFWASLLTFCYAYAGFPLLVVLLGGLRRGRAVRRAEITPSASLIIAAYNEADTLRARLVNALASDYPPEHLEIIVASDGSTDATEAIAASFAHRGVRLLRLPRAGKIAALEAAAEPH